MVVGSYGGGQLEWWAGKEVGSKRGGQLWWWAARVMGSKDGGQVRWCVGGAARVVGK